MAAPMDCHALRAISQDLARAGSYEKFNSTINDIFENYKPFHTSKSGQDLVTVINKCLGSSEHRLRGLNLLTHLIEQCSPETYNDNATSWSNQLLQLLLGYSDSRIYHEMACVVLSQILSYAGEFPDVNRSLASSVIPQLITYLINSKEARSSGQVVLECLKSCLVNFPGACGSARNKIETFLWHHLLEGNDTDREIAAVCYVLLPGCGGGGHQSIKHTEAWNGQIRKILNTLNRALRLLYAAANPEDISIEDGATEPTDDVVTQIFALPDEEPRKALTLTDRFGLLCSCLRRILDTKTNFTVSAPIEKILDFVCHGLSVDGRALVTRPTTERLFLAGVAVEIHHETLACLKSLIRSCRGAVYEHSQTINRMIAQSLRWTIAEPIPGQTRPLSVLRVAAYEAMSTWITVAGESSGLDRMVGEIIEHIISDAKPGDDAWVLMKSTDDAVSASKHGNKRRKKSAAPETNQILMKKIDPCANLDLCSSALKCLKSLLLSAASSLQSTHLTRVDEFLIVEILRMQQQNPHAGLYVSATCRTNLYDALKARVLVSHATIAPPIACAWRLFSTGRRDASPTVATVCAEGSAICNSVIHPRMPPIGAGKRTAPRQTDTVPDNLLTSVFNWRQNKSSATLTKSVNMEMDADEGGILTENRNKSQNLILDENSKESKVSTRKNMPAQTDIHEPRPSTSRMEVDVSEKTAGSSSDEDEDDSGGEDGDDRESEERDHMSPRRSDEDESNKKTVVATKVEVISISEAAVTAREDADSDKADSDDVVGSDKAGSDDAAEEMLAAFVDAGPDSD
ncbi:proline-, glutamic acid- and leucine-rich protein 1-like [Tubulanus polymorphus]|uniref:proline-, glutamic acid- and leucine-rich protein 1-like n=1 Tax=Tubulanus polymorphus TaxID=672921 RepID=UPI003DA4EF7B